MEMRNGNGEMEMSNGKVTSCSRLASGPVW